MQITKIVANISSADKYPTRQQGNIKAGAAAIKQRMLSAEDEVLALFDSIPVKSINVNQLQNNELYYQYELSATRFLQVEEDIKSIIAKWLEVQDVTQKPARWFFNPYLDKAYSSGTAASLTRMTSALESTAFADTFDGQFLMSQLDYENVLLSEPYRRRIELVAARTFNSMAGFADENGVRLSQILAQGVAGGQSPATISTLMQKEFEDIQGWRALRIARTEINTAHNVARSDASKDARDRLGVELKVMHVSALLETTRKHHADRHGLLFTPEAQDLWWSIGANRISCYCTTVEIIFINGEPLQKDLIKKTRAKGQKYLGIEREYEDGINPD